MELVKLLEETIQKQKQLVDQINLLKQREQELLQEAIRLEGEIRVLQRLDHESSAVVKQKQGE